MYIQVDFGQLQQIDEVRMWTSTEYNWPMRFEVHADGRKIADAFAASPNAEKEFLGRAATYEIYMRGVRFLVIPDSDHSADQMADAAEAWGLAPVTRVVDKTLYRILPP